MVQAARELPCQAGGRSQSFMAFWGEFGEACYIFAHRGAQGQEGCAGKVLVDPQVT